MKFHKIECDGEFILEIITASFPTWASGQEGRMMFIWSTDRIYFGGRTGWQRIWADGEMGYGSGLDADYLDGYRAFPPNLSGNIPLNNGTINVNLNSDLLDDQHGSYYRNASNLNAGTVPAARLSGTYNINITGSAGAARYS